MSDTARRPRKNARTYMLRSIKAHNGTTFGSLTVPSEVAALVPEGTRFAIEMTDDGILYRAIQPAQVATTRPAWATPEAAETPASGV